ncbi:MAG: DUF2007 domain-containing protein [Ignavibacteria bacterium]|nr:DUF2007 domain-containing protein [Ignavibacteria bacterium]
MNESSDLTRIFTGSEVLVYLLKDALEANGIGCLIKNDFRTGNLSGFMGGTRSAIDLFILTSDLENAQSILDDFNQLNHE